MRAQACDISVVICAHTEARWEQLGRAVASLRSQSIIPREILVVIDHNLALADRACHQLPGARVIENTQERGISGARNSGIAAARGAIIAFLDDDAIAAPDWLEQLLAGYSSPNILGVGGAIEPQWPERRPRWFPEEFDWVVGCTYLGMPSEAAPVRNLIGCNMSFRREVFVQIGGFRNEIGRVGAQPFGCDETELCIRLGQRQPHALLIYTPLARVRHAVPEARARWEYFRARCQLEGRSKALVARLVGAGDGSATERAYTLRTLPRGIARGLADTLLGDPGGLARAAAISLGLAITTAGYIQGMAGQLVARRSGIAAPPTIGIPLATEVAPSGRSADRPPAWTRCAFPSTQVDGQPQAPQARFQSPTNEVPA
jgi:GT2 family glycosyltransferase